MAGVTFLWEWIPQVIAPFLQIFTWVCWIAPENVVVNQIFGGQTGLGLMPISFDWSVISGFLSSPLQSPGFCYPQRFWRSYLHDHLLNWSDMGRT